MTQRLKYGVMLGASSAVAEENEIFKRFAEGCAEQITWIGMDEDLTADAIKATLGYSPDILVSQKKDGYHLAQELSAAWAPFELPRLELDQTLPKRSEGAVKTRRIAIVGPESTGKSTLCRQLAKHYHTMWVPEYARIYCDAKPVALTVDDVEPIARGHYALEEALAPLANDFLFIDTDAVMTSLYSTIYYNHSVPWLEELTREHGSDLYLVLAPDVPWVVDPQRDLPHLRDDYFQRCIEELRVRQRNIAVIRGAWHERFAEACCVLDRSELIREI